MREGRSEVLIRYYMASKHPDGILALDLNQANSEGFVCVGA
jgi:hypothetical protein